MTLYTFGKNGMQPAKRYNTEVGKVYFCGSTIPADIVYITRKDEKYVYYVPVSTSYNTETGIEHRDMIDSFEIRVNTGMENMLDQYNKIDDRPINALIKEHYAKVLFDHDPSGYDLEFESYESYSERLNKEQAIRSERKARTRYIEETEVAKLVRAELKKYFPGHKFSVRTEKYSGGSSINVSWIDGPTSKEVDQYIKKFHGAEFDGMIDLKSSFDTELETGELVHYANDYIFTSRRYSLEFTIKIAAMTCKEFNYPENTIKVEINKWGSVNWNEVYDKVYGSNSRETLNDMFCNNLHETSDYTKPEEEQIKQERKQEYSAAITIGEYKGKPTISLPVNGFDFSFGVSKAKAILEYLKDIEQFVKDNS